MLHPAQKIASFFVAKKLIPAQDYEWAVYGLQRRLLAAVFYPILFLIGLLVSDVYSTVLFFVVFTSLRHCTRWWNGNAAALWTAMAGTISPSGRKL